MKTKTSQELIKLIEKERKIALKDCWNYHGKLIQSEGPQPKTKKSELEDFLMDYSCVDWEDVCFFIGYLRGLDWASEQFTEEENTD